MLFGFDYSYGLFSTGVFEAPKANDFSPPVKVFALNKLDSGFANISVEGLGFSGFFGFPNREVCDFIGCEVPG